jgi:hypothetical protein
MSLNQTIKTGISVALLLSVGALAKADVLEYGFNVNTSALQGLGTFSLAFQLSDGSGTGDGNNTVTLSNFIFFGGGFVGNSTDFGGATGNLSSGTASLTDTDPAFNALLQGFNPGSALSFAFTFTDNADVGFGPDLFTVSLLDPLGNGIPTLDPSGDDTVLTVALDGSASPPTGTWATDTSMTAYTVPAGNVVPNVPEPATLILLATALAGTLGLARRKRRA